MFIFNSLKIFANMKLKFKIVLINICCLLLFTTKQIQSQALSPVIKAFWQDQNVEIKNRTFFSNNLVLLNRTNEQQEVQIALNTSSVVYISNSINGSYTLMPGATVTLPISGIMTRQNTDINSIIALIKPTKNVNSIIQSEFFIVSNLKQVPLKIKLDPDQYYFSATVDTLHIPIKIQNFSQKKVSFSFNNIVFGKGINYTLLKNKQNIDRDSLMPFEHQLYTLTVYRNSEFKKNTNYSIQIQTIDQLKHISISPLISIRELGSKIVLNTLKLSYPTELNVEYRTQKYNYQELELGLKHKAKLGKGDLLFQSQYQYLYNSNASQIFNTFLKWQDSLRLVQLGEFVINGPIPVFGNGVYIKEYDKSNMFELWALLDKGLLYSSLNKGWSNDKTYGIRFTNKQKLIISQYQLSYIQNRTVHQSGLVGYLNKQYLITNGFLNLGAGITISKLTALAYSVVYHQRFGAFTFDSRWSDASTYFLGQNKGVSINSNKLIYRISAQKQWSIGMFAEKVKPTIIFPLFYRTYNNRYVFLSMENRKQNQLQVFKLMAKEEAQQIGTPMLYSQLRTIQFNYIQHWSRKIHKFNTDIKSAWSSLNNNSAISSFPAFKVELYWLYKNWYSRIHWQEGVLNLNSYAVQNPNVFNRKEWLIKYQPKLPKYNLSMQFELALFSESFTNKLRNRFTTDIKYVSSNQFSMHFGYTKLAYGLTFEPEFKFGLTYKPKQYISKQYTDIQLQLFKDVNNNGLKDANEVWLSNMVVKINNLMLITNSKGSLLIQEIRYGLNHLQIEALNYKNTFMVTKNKQMLVSIADTIITRPPIFNLAPKIRTINKQILEIL